jgi:drug/metabolite transporter (DMT)-like permease
VPPTVAALVLTSALLHACWNALLKRERETELAAVLIMAIATAFALAAVPLAPAPSFPAPRGIAWSLGAGACESGYVLTLAWGLRRAPLGVVYTISRGGALLAVWPVSLAWLGEALTPRGAAGAAAVLAGLVLVGTARAGRASPRGVGWAVVCAAFITGYHVCYKLALASGAEPTAVFAVALGFALPLNLLVLGRGGPARLAAALRARPAMLTLCGALCAASFLVFLVALARGGAGAVLTLRNTSVVFAAVLGWAIGERPGRSQLAGTAAVAAGAVFLGWPG